ncbi:MAG: phosphoglucosamine mutase [Candidatus Methanofastidiosia archaeon]
MKLFGTSGIRGIYGKEVCEELFLKIGKAVGTLLDGPVVVGMDSRTSSPSLKNALISGLISQGSDVYDIGLAPTPTVGVATMEYGCCAGVVVTASHNPPNYNGIKIWDSCGIAYLSLEKEIEKIVENTSFGRSKWDRIGEVVKKPSINLHMEKIMDNFSFDKKFNVAVDCGCGAGSVITPCLIEKLGMRVVSLNCQTCGFFPRGLEPSKSNLMALSEAVKSFSCDIGIANDGDADRIGAVDEKGNYVDYDILLSLIAGFECSRSRVKKPKIVTTVDASLRIDRYVGAFGGQVVRTAVGDVALANGVVKKKAIFGGEPSGTWIFPSFWLTPDGVLAAVKLLEMKAEGIDISEERNKIPAFFTLREKIPIKNPDKQEFEEKLREELESHKYHSISVIDGIRIDYAGSWALFRFSGTEPLFRITVEAESKARAEELMTQSKKIVEGLL